MSGSLVRNQPQRFAKAINGLLAVSQSRQRTTGAVERLGVVRLQAQRLVICDKRFPMEIGRRQSRAQIVMGGREVGFQFDGSPQRERRSLRLARYIQGAAKVVLRPRVKRPFGDIVAP